MTLPARCCSNHGPDAMWYTTVPSPFLSLTAGLLLAPAAPTRLSDHRHEPRGEWRGTYRTGEATDALTLWVDSTAAGWSVSVLAISRYVADPKPQVATDVRIVGDSVAFVLSWGTPVRWRGRFDDEGGTGTLVTDHYVGAWTVKRASRR